MNDAQQTPQATHRARSTFPTGLVCGVPVQAARREDFVRAIIATIAEQRAVARAGEDACTSCEAAYVATINSDFLANTRGRDRDSSARLLRTLRRARFSTADGMPVVWLLRATGLAVPERVTGVDLFTDVIRALPRAERRVFVVGGDSPTLERAARRMRDWHPDLKLHGAFPRLNSQGELIDADSGSPWDELHVRRFFSKINRKTPSILCLALGNPRQELFFDRYRHLIRVPIVMGLGGTINFIAGKVRRAPGLVGRLGLEWAFRLAMEPRRLAKRYIFDALHLIRTGGALLALHALQKLQIACTPGAHRRYFTGASRSAAPAPVISTPERNRATRTRLSTTHLDLTGLIGANACGLETILRCVEDPDIEIHGARRCGSLLRLALKLHQIDTGETR